MLACHHCDEPRCSNPLHIFPGTYSDNINDAYAKGRKQSGFGLGEDHHHSKLTADIILSIRDRIYQGETMTKVAADLGVHVGTVSRIANGKRWGWLQSRIA